MAFLRTLFALLLLAAALPTRAAEAEAVEGAAPVEAAAALDYTGSPKSSPYREHASLALFSLGSLAVGGVFYGIHSSLDYPGAPASSGNGTEVGAAIGAAGLTALAAGAAYFYYAWRGQHKAVRADRLQAVSAGLSPDGSLSATVTVPLPSLGK
jgi:hypothetical protein